MKPLLSIALLLALSACSAKHESLAPNAQRVAAAGAASAADGPAEKRYIATRHTLTLEAPEADLHKHFDAIQAACLKLECVVLNADQLQETPHQSARATLTARIPPKAFDSFLKTILEHSKLLQHHRESEDLTAEVIDVEAKIANLSALRSRILELLAKRTGDLKEVLEAEKQLADTQSQLDSIQGLRKALANKTDMARVELTLVAQSLHAERSWAAPVADAASESGRVLMSSVAVLITFTVAMLPWLLACIPLFLGIRKIYRKRKATRAQPAI